MCECVWARALSTRGDGISSPPLVAAGLGMDGVLLSVVDGGLPEEESESRLVCRSSSARQADGFYPFQVWLLLLSSRGRGRVCMHKLPPPLPPPNPGDTRYTQFMPCHAVGVLATGHEGREISRAAAEII